MRGQVVLRYSTIVVAATLLCHSAMAQTATGIIQGRVVDASGGAVPEAAVKIQNKKTGVQSSTVTNAQGAFLQPYLIPGEYALTVEKAGFDKNVTPDLRLSVQQTIELELTMKVGEITTTVEVSAASAQLNTSTSAVSTVITNKAMLDLPLNGRNPFGLATLVPGVFPGGGSTPWLGGGRN